MRSHVARSPETGSGALPGASMDTARLTEALQWLGPLTVYELADVLKLSRRHVQRLVVAAGYGRDEDGRVSLATRRPRSRPTIRAVRELVDDGGEVYADWLVERTGYGRRAVYDALRDLGFSARRGRGAAWTRAAAAK